MVMLLVLTSLSKSKYISAAINACFFVLKEFIFLSLMEMNLFSNFVQNQVKSGPLMPRHNPTEMFISVCGENTQYLWRLAFTTKPQNNNNLWT